MKRAIVLLCACLLLSTAPARAVSISWDREDARADATKPPAHRGRTVALQGESVVVDVFLLGGQSNAAGRGAVS